MAAQGTSATFDVAPLNEPSILHQSATERHAASPSSYKRDGREIDSYLDVLQRFSLASSLASMKFYGQTLRSKAE